MLVTETFHGYIETTQDVLLIFEGCRRGLLPRICRRLQEKERKMIRSGSVFVFDERESGIKRWTDGLVWSPSRILGNFLIYRELDKRSAKRGSLSAASSSGGDIQDARQRSLSADHSSSAVVAAAGGIMSNIDRNRERQLVGSLSDSYKFRKDGLIKKTMSIVVNGVSQHLISYYDPQDVLQNRLRTPSSVPELASLEISPELLVKQNFRIPPMVEPTTTTFDHHHHYHHQGGDADPYGADRRHQFRSNSLGALRADQLGGIVSRPDIMYGYPHHHHPDKHTMAPYGNQQQPVMFPGYPAAAAPASAIPSSPSSSSSPTMMSPVRPSFHQRHYSISSSSSGSMSRMDPRNYDLLQQQRERPPSTTFPPSSTTAPTTQPQFHPMVSEVAGFCNEQHRLQQQQQQQQQQEQQDQQHSDHSRGANIGQLLNPVHPLHNGVQESSTAIYYPTSTSMLYDIKPTIPPSKHECQPPQQEEEQKTNNAATTTATSTVGGVSDGSSGGGGSAAYRQQHEQQTMVNTYSMVHHPFEMHPYGNNEDPTAAAAAAQLAAASSDLGGPLMLK